jgi:short-subunit dehydrogenase
MVDQGFGHIVNMSSYQELIPAGAATAYATTKHGVGGLIKNFRALQSTA